MGIPTLRAPSPSSIIHETESDWLSESVCTPLSRFSDSSSSSSSVS